MMIKMTEEQYQTEMLQLRTRILEFTAPEHRATVEDALDNVVPEVLWAGILTNAETYSTASDPHWITGFAMAKDCISIHYHRPMHATEKYRSVSYLFN